ncbi:tRNA-dihydrouridine synthase family protein [Thermosulfurimonas marina]|uniref:tRNA-dihydrouridine synthase n=1 Tax=Thermosulfurimonas marina TaxID=2047767 RepID=A0A6H1WRG3_9BACT|nr:tRNA-dihydrouridine synthase family protein [Thermosulfurimonas marina]QJA05749.1 tRNA-dihydrouridine synthase family protein [Thermosulfurimonas marina]
MILLAPMDGLTHVAFRRVVARYGPPDLFYTEMVSVRAVVFQPPERDPYLWHTDLDRPLVVQLAGREPDLFEEALRRLEERFNFYGYDLNLGCTRGRARRQGWGAALLLEPDLVRAIARAARRATAKPLSAKLRSPPGHDRRKLFRLAEILLEEGVDTLILHPRAPEEGFRRPPRWEEVRELKEKTGARVIGNGDIFSPEEARRRLEETGCDGIMLGRVALLRPFIFRDLRAFLEGRGIPEPPPPLEPPRLFAEELKLLPEGLQEKRLELWLFWYLQNFPYGLYYFGKVKKISGLSAKLKTLSALLSSEAFPPYPAHPRLHR